MTEMIQIVGVICLTTILCVSIFVSAWHRRLLSESLRTEILDSNAELLINVEARVTESEDRMAASVSNLTNSVNALEMTKAITTHEY